MATVNYEYIAELEIDKVSGLYNLFITTYNGNSVDLNIFFVRKKHAMRLDLVSNEIYGTTRYVGTICQLNNILDPFSIRENDVLFYTDTQNAEALLVVAETIRQSGIDELRSQVKNELINALKKKKNDPSRAKYLNNRNSTDTLPPNILPETVPQSVIDTNKIIIGSNLFKKPTSEPISLNTETSISSAKKDTINEDRVERVLVNQYIKQINK